MKARPPTAARPDTRHRLLDAASRIFARDGLTGATTREIAREAGVNEVTLFRHFRSKEGLLAAVVGSNFGTAARPEAADRLVPTGDLRADLLAHAWRYEALLTDNLPLVRTMIGEIHRHGDHQREVFKAIFQPLRDAFLSRLADAQAAGKLRPDFDRHILADLFFGMIFAGVLRRAASHIRLSYSPTRHLQSMVDLVLRGAAV